MRRIAAILLTLLLAACTPGISPSASTAPAGVATGTPTAKPSAKPSPSSTASPTARPTATPSVSPAPEPTGDLGGFICQFPYAVDGSIDRAQITDVRTGAHGSYERIVFEFQKGIPAFDIKVGTPPFTLDPSGLPLAVAGSDFLVVVLHGGTGLTPDGTVTYSGPTDFTPHYPLLKQFVQAGDFEAVSEWVAGLSAPACVRVFALDGPSRLVIDLQAK